jgi:AmmeMemoRadiSam system protein A
MSPLCSDDRRALLELARRAIVEAVCQGRVVESPAPTGALAAPAGAFVTLHRRGRLCGCIGQVAPSDSLAVTVVHCAIGAATKDPRFRPMRPEELAELEIELSILSPLEPITPEALEVGRHGLMVVRDYHRGVLLPQVATEHRWSREHFLEQTCEKAGLPPGAWRDPGTQILGFTAEIFSEADFHIEQQAS